MHLRLYPGPWVTDLSHLIEEAYGRAALIRYFHMPNNSPALSIIDEICDYSLQVAAEISWLGEPLTRSRGRAYLLQHILRNRLFSSVMRPAWMSRCPDLAVVRKTMPKSNGRAREGRS